MNDNKIKKIAFVATVYRHLEAFHMPFMSLLSSKGYEVHAYAAFDQGKEELLKNNIVCHDMPFKRTPFHVNNLKALKQLKESFKKEHFQMIHAHTPIAGIVARIAGNQAKVPNILYTAHGFHFFKGAPLTYWVIYYPVERMMARLTDFLITINEEDFIRAKKFKVRNKNLLIPGVGVELPQFYQNNNQVKEDKRNEIGLNKQHFVILCVAELNNNKNHIQLIEAIRRLVPKYNSIRCLIVGTGEDEEGLKKIVSELDLIDYITFLGFRRDISSLLAISDCVTLLSKREGLPKALLEALAAGKPIVATNVRGSRDLVINHENGYLVPLSDINATYEAFERLMNNPIKRTQMGERSRELVKQYDLEVILQQIDKIYQEVL